MYKIVDNFEKQYSYPVVDSLTLKCGNSIKIYPIETVHELTQFIGYGKYLNKSKGDVYFRGQTSLYGGAMMPSFYRNKENEDQIIQGYNARVNKLINGNPAFSRYDRATLEPLLQHYGIKTPYIDLVDNIWVALWFALHQAKVVAIKSHEYVYYYESQNPYAYIILMLSDATHETDIPGVYSGEYTTFVDLRKAIPSYFLRPHAQHAYMIRKNQHSPSDYSDLIVGIVKIPTDLGLKWLGSNEFLSVRGLFPSAHFDSGYKMLLEHYPEKTLDEIKLYGAIQIVTD